MFPPLYFYTVEIFCCGEKKWGIIKEAKSPRLDANMFCY